MRKYFDINNNRLVFINKKAEPKYWDNHWLETCSLPPLDSIKVNRFDYVVRHTLKYLPKKAKILEGGCGNGNQVAKLSKLGYNVVGLDYAEKTIELLQKNYAELTFKLGDVRKLPFGDDYFDGYWSFGVIEHFYGGYDQIAKEMNRVLKIGGYLFLTFPHISRLRQRKARNNQYRIWTESKDMISDFYQFALDEKIVIKYFEKLGFKFVSISHLNSIKGLKDEKPKIKKTLQKIYDSRTIFGTIGRQMINLLYKKYSSHSVLCVFRKIQ